MSSLVSTSLSEAFRWIDENKNHQIELLRQAVAIPSVSGWPLTHRNHSLKCAEYFRNRLQELGFSTELRQLSTKQNIDGEIIDLPPLVLAQSKDEDPNKKILLVYAHIDVQPAEKSDGWDTEPFELTERNGKLFGRGATDDKGPAIAWTNAIEAFQKTGSKIPINIRFILEGMEESGSEGLEDELRSMKEKNDPFLQGIDFCVISDSYWLGQVKPCLAYGLRGIICCVMVIECANQDLHSGCCGGLVYEAMPDLIWLLDRLVDKEGNILIPGIMDQVRPMTQEEEDTYKTIDFDLDGKRNEIGAAKFINGNDPIKTLEHLWRFPCLSIHGIEGAFHEKGFKTVIPRRVIGKFSIRTVPDMTIEDTKEKILSYLNDIWNRRGSPNKATFIIPDAGSWYYVDPVSPNFAAARRAVKKVFDVEPDLVREGGSIPITVVLSECTGKDVCLLPIGRSNDGAHSQNEKIDIVNYINGSKVMAAYMEELTS